MYVWFLSSGFNNDIPFVFSACCHDDFLLFSSFISLFGTHFSSFYVPFLVVFLLSLLFLFSSFVSFSFSFLILFLFSDDVQGDDDARPATQTQAQDGRGL